MNYDWPDIQFSNLSKASQLFLKIYGAEGVGFYIEIAREEDGSQWHVNFFDACGVLEPVEPDNYWFKGDSFSKVIDGITFPKPEDITLDTINNYIHSYIVDYLLESDYRDWESFSDGEKSRVRLLAEAAWDEGIMPLEETLEICKKYIQEHSGPPEDEPDCPLIEFLCDKIEYPFYEDYQWYQNILHWLGGIGIGPYASYYKDMEEWKKP